MCPLLEYLIMFWRTMEAAASPLHFIGSLMGFCVHAWPFGWPATFTYKNLDKHELAHPDMHATMPGTVDKFNKACL